MIKMSNHVSFKLGGAPFHRMRSGVGASWHSILNAPVGHGGSAFGGQPPVLPQHEPLWQSIEAHADYLRLRFIRLEFEWRQFEPQRGEYTWDSPEMQVLDRICAWAERNGADVMLQQQWGGVAWNTFDEFKGDPAMETYSAAADLDAFAEGWMALLNELCVRRGYRCIKWINPINEPGYWWWHLPESYRILREEGDRERSRALQIEHLSRACSIVRSRLRVEHPQVRLMGPDETDMPVYDKLSAEPWFNHVDDIDFHSYNSSFDHDALPQPWFYHIADRIDGLLSRYCTEAHAADKGLYLTEVGSMAYGYGFDDFAPGCELSALKDSEMLIRSLRAGVDGFSRWSFTNRGDIDGQWQLIETWNRDHKNWLKEASPHRPAYDVLGRAMRNVPKCAAVLPLDIEGGLLKGGKHRRVWGVCVQDPESGQQRILAVNNSEEPFELSLQLSGSGAGTGAVAGANGNWSVLDPWSGKPTKLDKIAGGFGGLLHPRQLTIFETAQ